MYCVSASRAERAGSNLSGEGPRCGLAWGEMDGFVATFTNRLDQKGRVSVPASFRAALTREGFDGVYCYPALDQPAIDAGGARLKQAIDERLSVFETFSEDYEILSTAFYGASRVLKIDKDGRITLPDDLREDAGITDSVVFVGQGFKFQIWAPEQFASRQKDARARLKEVTRALGSRRAAPSSGGNGQ